MKHSATSLPLRPLESRHAQVQVWVESGKHDIQVNYDQIGSDGSLPAWEDPAPVQPSTNAADVVSTSSSGITADASSYSDLPQNLVGAHRDWLIPEPTQIRRIYQQGLQTWAQLLASAKALPPNSLPAAAGDPAIMLKDVPALPSVLPRSSPIVGQSVWHVPEAEDGDGINASQETSFALDQPYGTQKYVHLSYPTPIVCRMSSSADSGRACWPGLLILTRCWSYIFSVRLWELQGKAVVSTRHRLEVKPGHDLEDSDDLSMDVKIDLRKPASRRLVTWLSAVLAPKQSWAPKATETQEHSPWTMVLPTDLQISLYADEHAEVYRQDKSPPTSAEAAELLVEFCALFGLGKQDRRPGRPRKNISEPSPVTAAFLAALALPFYRCLEFQPRFSPPFVQRSRQVSQTHSDLVRSYVKDLSYYMTLSMQPSDIGSIVWSIFWQPEVECNLVGPWLSSILSVLRPIIDAGDTGLLTRVFALRRPRVALWWFGIFALGSRSMLPLILRYLDTLEERWGYGSMARPDTTASVWIGAPQSFHDDSDSSMGIYTDQKAMVPFTDVLKYRYNLRLQDDCRTPLAWRPFGYLPKEKIEVDLWPWLEKGRTRRYLHWVWWVKKDGIMTKDIQYGFRHDTGRFLSDVPDNLDMAPADEDARPDEVAAENIKLEPSLQATLRMIGHCMDDVDGEGYLGVEVDEAKKHPWLRDWR